MHRQIQVEVVVMEHVGARPEHRREMLAGARVRLVQKRGFLSVRLLPLARDHDLAPVGEPEAGDVDRIAERMFRQLRARDIVDRAAAIGAECVEPDDPLAEPRLRDRLHDLARAKPRSRGSSNNLS